MHIGINAQLLSGQAGYRQAGVSKYIAALLEQYAHIDQCNNYTVWAPSGSCPNGKAHCKNIRFVPSLLPTERPQLRIAWEQLVLPFASARLDVLHCPVNVQPFHTFCPTVVTVHDLIYLIYPDKYLAAKRKYLTAATAWSVSKASRIIAVSESTKRDLVRLLNVPAEKITVIHNGVDERFRPISDENMLAQFKHKHGLPPRFILYVGTIEPRKNLTILIDAFIQLRQRPDMADLFLVLAGGKGWLYEEVFKQAEKAKEGIIFPGYVDAEELPLWYNSANLFVYPSLYEGFGLPVAEALACGVPVIAANTSSLPEVLGDAGILIEPDDTAGLADNAARILGDHTYALELSTRGQKRGAQFSWRSAAESTMQVYSVAGLSRR